MDFTKVVLNVPEGLAPFVEIEDEKSQMIRNAMLLLPYIKSDVISHGKVAEMLRVNKLDLITIYGSFGIPYFDATEEDFLEDAATVRMMKPECPRKCLPDRLR